MLFESPGCVGEHFLLIWLDQLLSIVKGIYLFSLLCIQIQYQ